MRRNGEGVDRRIDFGVRPCCPHRRRGLRGELLIRRHLGVRRHRPDAGHQCLLRARQAVVQGARAAFVSLCRLSTARSTGITVCFKLDRQSLEVRRLLVLYGPYEVRRLKGGFTREGMIMRITFILYYSSEQKSSKRGYKV